MATTMIPPTDVSKPAAPGPRRVATVRANLLPDEVISARQALVVRRQVLTALGALVVLIVACYGLSWWQTRSARNDLDSIQRRNTTLTDQQNQFRPVVEAQSGALRISTQLHRLMAGDLSWNDLINRIRGAAPSGVTVTDLDGTVSTGTATGTAPAAAVPAAPGTAAGTEQPVGTLTLSGSARDKNSVAAFADKLGRVRGLSTPLITSVATTDHQVTFSIDVTITGAALGGRYSATAAPTTTGGN
jgi:Tfp pilus assembly protein PilN